MKAKKQQYALNYRIPWVMHEWAMFPRAMHGERFLHFMECVLTQTHGDSVTWWVDLPDMNERELDRVFVYHAEWMK
jgi:hypothetical protein